MQGFLKACVSNFPSFIRIIKTAGYTRLRLNHVSYESESVFAILFSKLRGN